jgi:phage terminase small subunit
MGRLGKKKISSVRIVEVPLEDLGPAMAAVTEQQRRWVVAYAMCGDATSACRSAGYSDASEGCKVAGFRLLRTPRVIEALQEWTRGALEGRGAFIAVQALIEIAADPDHKKRFEAADSLADRVGFSRQTNVNMTVEHTDNRSTASLMEAVRAYFQPRAAAVIEAAAEEVHADS